MGTIQETAKGKWFKKNLRGILESRCAFTSKSTFEYNCVGYAVGDFRWWHPAEQKEHYWPEGVARNFLAQTYVDALKTVHFEECPIQTDAQEPGFEKFALFHKAHKFTHIAIIAADGVWKSKLGNLEDIEHPPAVRSKFGSYGLIFKYLRREMRYAREGLLDEYRI